MAPDHDEPLSLPPEEVRRLGYRVVDMVVDHLAGLRDLPPVVVGERAALEARLREPLPEAPGDLDEALDLAAGVVLRNMQHGDHPRFFARVPSPSSPVGMLGDALASGMNAIATSWVGSTGPTVLELVVLDWLAEMLGMPAGTEGILLSGGSASSLTALAAARAARLGGHDPDAVVYCSDQTHASITRALRILGFAPDRVRLLPTGSGFRLVPGAVAGAIAADRSAGLRPFCLIATAGTTNTGTVDPLAALADLAAAEGLWLHVDGAYGAPAALTEQGRALLDGMERADSLAADPHKWLFAPYEVGALLVREPGALAAAFAMEPEYLRDTTGEVNFRDRGPQLTRATRALKLWLTIKAFGVDAIRDAVARGIALAERAEAALRATPGWEIVTPAQLAVVTFAHERAGAVDIAARAVADGYAVPTSTVLRGRPVLRLCTINPRTTDEEIDATVARLTELAERA
ncbi:pyridoxal phosphate-dependent decarboxylase family protein [Capillimicrobium parvum]|uniref:Tryptophan decarboxylase n=1 Tax=Capillimicrobium parvum TaxID=2884022 RepID=A0A9E6XVF3_9ACTN|nr:aminotransferase class I/II-fold pyridoxal phosphate-dependent enzyme [Capillimicrobium parvum]UGS34491.1 Tryptophan decarboxylase [Capillimicrobium parvum]